MLTMLVGPTPGAIQPITDQELVLGRGEELGSRIDDRGMSRRHARIFKVQEHFYLEDLQSTNGTLVNGVKLNGRHRLADGDRIQLGENTLLRATLQDAKEEEAARRLYESAVRDPLTHIYNRGHFDERLRSEFAFAHRHAMHLVVMLFDLDHFKNINDAWGHQAGDAVLQTMTAAVTNAIRTEDVFARYGGEEFVLIARDQTQGQAMQLAERIRATVEALEIPWDNGPIKVTTSIGVALFEQANYSSGEQLLAAADEAVYRAKAGGRNRSCLARPRLEPGFGAEAGGPDDPTSAGSR